MSDPARSAIAIERHSALRQSIGALVTLGGLAVIGQHLASLLR